MMTQWYDPHGRRMLEEQGNSINIDCVDPLGRWKSFDDYCNKSNMMTLVSYLKFPNLTGRPCSWELTMRTWRWWNSFWKTRLYHFFPSCITSRFVLSREPGCFTFYLFAPSSYNHTKIGWQCYVNMILSRKWDDKTLTFWIIIRRLF